VEVVVQRSPAVGIHDQDPTGFKLPPGSLKEISGQERLRDLVLTVESIDQDSIEVMVSSIHKILMPVSSDHIDTIAGRTKATESLDYTARELNHCLLAAWEHVTDRQGQGAGAKAYGENAG
jgi:hypothetical protein